jgi:hypothetical protein
MDAGGRAKPGAFAEKDTPPGMEAVDRVGNRRSRMRGVLQLFSPHLTLSRRERGKQPCALFDGRISMSSLRLCVLRVAFRELQAICNEE